MSKTPTEILLQVGRKDKHNCWSSCPFIWKYVLNICSPYFGNWDSNSLPHTQSRTEYKDPVNSEEKASFSEEIWKFPKSNITDDT